LDAPKAANTSQQHVTSMYRQAVMAGGPQPTGLMGKFFASAVLDQGFVGSALHLHQVIFLILNQLLDMNICLNFFFFSLLLYRAEIGACSSMASL
jgi:hypothetical protein